MRRIHVPDPALVVLVGASGSGKSTFAARHFAPDEILSSDAYRERISGDPADQRASGLAFRFLHDELARRSTHRRRSVVDATNIAPQARRVLLGRARDARYPVTAIVLDLPRDVVLARNAARTERTVPEAVVLDQLRRLRLALDGGAGTGLRTEGYDEVVILTTETEVDAVRVEWAS